MIHWGFIGSGDVTEKKSGPAFGKVQGSDVVAVMSRNKEKAKDYAQRHNIEKWFTNADELINDKSVNAIYVATPPGSHAGYAISAMKAGKPVYIEKPMAASFADCEKIMAVAKETKIPCFVAYYRRTLPYFLRVKQLIDDASVGNICNVQIRFAIPPIPADMDKNNLPWRVKKEIAGAGYFYDLAAHQLDLLDYFFGPIRETSGFTANAAALYDVEDSVSAAFKFQSGVIGSGSWSFAASNNQKTDRIDIVGTKGRISFSTFQFSPISLQTTNTKQEFTENNPTHIQFNLIKSIVDYLNGNAKMPVSSGLTAMRTNWVMDKILNRI